MSAPHADEVRTFLPEILDVERDKRATLLSYRNAASAMIASANSDLARHLAWSTVEYASANAFAPAPLDWLDKVNALCRRLLLTACQAEDMHLEIMGAIND